MHPTDYTFKLYEKNQDSFTSIASKRMSRYHYWLNNGVKFFSLQFYSLKRDEPDPTFLSILRNVTHRQTNTKFLQHKKPQNYFFANYKYTSFTMTNLYTIDHSKITGYLRTLLRPYKTILLLPSTQ